MFNKKGDELKQIRTQEENKKNTRSFLFFLQGQKNNCKLIKHQKVKKTR